jgi:ribose transport system ATP-binding protein
MDVQAPVSSYNFEKRKIVEIAKALYYDPRLFIVDETTSVLSHESREIIYSLMKELKEKNRAILFISHALDELMEVCDVLTVLRDGALTDTILRYDFDENRIKQSMVGRELIGDYYRSDYDGSTGEEIVLSVNDVTAQALKGVSFELHKGEILGVAGLSGSGMHELGRLAFGMEEVTTGQVFAVNPADGTSVEIDGIHSALKCSMGYISKDRDKETLIVSASIKDNLALSALDQLGPIISPRAEKAFALEQVESLLIKCSSINQEVGELSGGNKQKVSFGKWIGNRSKILVMDSPTRGVDVGIKTAMYQLIYELKKSGYSILLISEEMGELIGMSDSILVMKDGGINKRFYRDKDLGESQIIDYLI